MVARAARSSLQRPAHDTRQNRTTPVYHMLKLNIIVIGKLKEAYWRDAEQEYRKRLTPFVELTVTELKEEPFTNKDNPEHIKKKEAEKIRAQLDDSSRSTPSYIIALSHEGVAFSSPKLAGKLEQLFISHGSITICIGGPLGLADDIKQRADLVVSLSPLTFTHQMARVILLEQLYRAMTIIKKRPYHY